MDSGEHRQAGSARFSPPAMRNVVFTVFGGGDDSLETRGTLGDLLFSVPYLLSARLVPPLPVVNDLLETGGSDAGMSGGCTWEPFSITESEWNELVHELAARGSDDACAFVEPPEWVRTVADWSAWIMIFKYGYPEELRHIERECRELERARDQARNAGNVELAEELDARVTEADERLAQLIMDHRKKPG